MRSWKATAETVQITWAFVETGRPPLSLKPSELLNFRGYLRQWEWAGLRPPWRLRGDFLQLDLLLTGVRLSIRDSP